MGGLDRAPTLVAGPEGNVGIQSGQYRQMSNQKPAAALTTICLPSASWAPIGSVPDMSAMPGCIRK
jgi:hypothetical protein